MSRPNKPPKPQMPKPGTDDEYMNLFFSQTESPFSALNRELHEVEVSCETFFTSQHFSYQFFYSKIKSVGYTV